MNRQGRSRSSSGLRPDQGSGRQLESCLELMQARLLEPSFRRHAASLLQMMPAAVKLAGSSWRVAGVAKLCCWQAASVLLCTAVHQCCANQVPSPPPACPLGTHRSSINPAGYLQFTDAAASIAASIACSGHPSGRPPPVHRCRRNVGLVVGQVLRG